MLFHSCWHQPLLQLVEGDQILWKNRSDPMSTSYTQRCKVLHTHITYAYTVVCILIEFDWELNWNCNELNSIEFNWIELNLRIVCISLSTFVAPAGPLQQQFASVFINAATRQMLHKSILTNYTPLLRHHSKIILIELNMHSSIYLQYIYVSICVFIISAVNHAHKLNACPKKYAMEIAFTVWYLLCLLWA